MRRTHRAILLGTLVLTLASAGARTESGLPGPRALPLTALRPNIVFILTDDQDLDLQSMNFMPLTNALIARQGMTFTQDFVPLSLCCPSRSTILTGLYPHNHQVYTNHLPNGGFEKFENMGLERTTIGTALHAAGYRTGLFGKYLNHYPRGSDPTHVPPGWDRFVSPSGGSPYSEFKYYLNQNGTIVKHGRAPADYLTDVLAGQAVGFIQAAAGSGQPFLLYFAPYAPHKPATPAPRHAKLFQGIQAPRTPSFNEADVGDKPSFVRSLPLLSKQDILAIDQLYRLRLQSLQAVDEAVQAIVQALQQTGQLDNTYIVFTSDNGFHMGQHRMESGKYTPYDTDIHMPLFVRGPGVVPGSTTSALTSSVDFAPSLADIGGAALQTVGDGRSLMPLLRGETPAVWRQAVLLEQFAFAAGTAGTKGILEPNDPQDRGVGVYPGHLGVRTADWKYVEYSDGEVEVYDLRHDPDELSNSATSAPASWLSQASALAHALGTCAGDACRQLETQPLPPPH